MEFSQDLIRGSVVPIILAMLQDKPMYGYELVKAVNARTNGLLEWKEGTLYPALHRLEADGIIRGRWVDTPKAETPGRKRKYYSILHKGRTELARRTLEWQQFSGAVNACLLGV